MPARTNAEPDEFMDAMATVVETPELTAYGLKKAYGKELQGSPSGMAPFSMRWVEQESTDPLSNQGVDISSSV